MDSNSITRQLRNFAILFALVSCSSGDSSTEVWRKGAWQLESYTNESGVLVDVIAVSPYQLKFEKRNSLIRSYINCSNQASGYFELFDDYITIALGSDNFIGECFEDNTNALKEQSDRVLQLLGLNQTTPVELMLTDTGSNLRLETSEGQVLLFRHIDTLHEVSSSEVIKLLTRNDWSTISFTDKDQATQNIPIEAEWKIRFRTNSTTGSSILIKYVGPCSFIYMSYSIDEDKLIKQGFETPDGPRCAALGSVWLGVEIELMANDVLRDSTEFFVKQENPDELKLQLFTEYGQSFTLIPEK